MTNPCFTAVRLSRQSATEADPRAPNWASRDNRELIYTKSGFFHIFLDPRGSGYVKIADASAFSEKLGANVYTEKLGTNIYMYYEHLSAGLDTLTYWGTAESFSP